MRKNHKKGSSMLETIFYHIDEFNKQFEKDFNTRLLSSGENKRKRSFSLTASEVMTITLFYHYSGYKTFKDYYEKHVLCYMRDDFKGLVSYNRFLELRNKVVAPLTIFLQLTSLKIKEDNEHLGVSFIDSFSLEVCHIKRASSHKTFAGSAAKGKTSTGWFFGFKVHIVTNPCGEIIACAITPGNVADNNRNILMLLTKGILGKIFGDKGYLVNEQVRRELANKGVHIVTKLRKDMKNKLMPLEDRLLLKKRGIIESVGSVLKETFSLEHSRHRSYAGFLSHVISTLVAYFFKPNKPSIMASNPIHLSLA